MNVSHFTQNTYTKDYIQIYDIFASSSSSHTQDSHRPTDHSTAAAYHLVHTPIQSPLSFKCGAFYVLTIGYHYISVLEISIMNNLNYTLIPTHC